MRDAGFAVVPDIVAGERCDELIALVSSDIASGVSPRSLLEQPWCADLADDLANDDRLKPLLPDDPICAQCTLFDKNPDRNWLVTLHQDLSIPVRQRIDSDACSGWSVKDGMLFVQPPVEVLQKLVAVRVHLDASTSENGPLRVVPGSHRQGRLDDQAEADLRRNAGETEVLVDRGGVIVMSPLTLHASSKSRGPAPRRVLHFVFGPRILPGGLEWPSIIRPPV
jgi:hypothetical protein